MNQIAAKPMRQVFGERLAELGAAVPELVVLDADTACSTQTSLFAARFPDRFIDCGIAECNMVSVAAGMTCAGLRPVVSTFAFLLATRASDQVRSQIAYSRLPVVLAGGYAGLSDFADGGSHQSIADLAFFTSMPNMTVLCPGDATETELALEAALKHDGPVYLRLSRAEVDRLPFPGTFTIGKAVVRAEGRDVALLSTGHILDAALAAAVTLRRDGVGVRVLDLPTLKPLDEAAVAAAARECGAVVTCEEHGVYGGLGSAVCGFLAQGHPAPVEMACIRDTFGQSGSYEELRNRYGLSARHIAQLARRVMARKRQECIA